MSKEEIISRLRELVSKKLEIDTKGEKIGETTPLMDYGLGVDSVSTMEFIVALENEFGIEIDEAEVNPAIFSTMDSVATYIMEKLDSGQ